MRSSTHTAIGLAGAAGVSAVVGADTAATVGCLAAAIVGSQLPDADQRGAKVHRLSRTERRHPLLAIIGLLARLPLRAMLLFKHRGPTHWLLTGLLVSCALAAVAGAIAPVAAFPVGAGVACGYLLHTLADACTTRGSPLLGPFDRRRVRLLPGQLLIGTGGSIDGLLGAGAMCLAIGVLVLTA